MDVNGSKEINNKITEVVIFRHKLTFHNDFVKRWMKVHDEKGAFESSCIACQKMKRSFPKVDDVELPDHIGDRHELTCDICVRLCLSKEGKWSHIWSHHTRTSTNYEILIIYVIFGEDMEISSKIKIMTTKYMCHVCQLAEVLKFGLI